MVVIVHALFLAACFVGGSFAAEPADITRCTTGTTDILGNRKAYAVQVCNLFGATCYMNHPSIGSNNCGTHALTIETGKCKLYTIFEYKDNAVRSGDSAVELMSSDANLECKVSSSNSAYTWSGACVSVQCALGDSFAGPGMTGNSNSRKTKVGDTNTAVFTSNTLASIPSLAKQLGNVFLYRTGSYVATYKRGAYGNSNSISYNVGDLPASSGNNYGPVVCPSTGNLLTSEAANGITAENLRMCGAAGKWVYYNAMNLLVDAEHYAKLTAGSASDLDINKIPFLYGNSKYLSGTQMATPRKVKLLSGNSAGSSDLLTSQMIVPETTGASAGEVAGTWRNYGVVFYCDDYERTDLTACNTANQKMFYVADPNPNAQFGHTATDIGGGGNSGTGGSGTDVDGTQWMTLNAAVALLVVQVAFVSV